MRMDNLFIRLAQGQTTSRAKFRLMVVHGLVPKFHFANQSAHSTHGPPLVERNFLATPRPPCGSCTRGSMARTVGFHTYAAPPTSRVLHTGREYTLGRKEGAVDLCIPLFRISRLAGTLYVAPMPLDAVPNADVIPKVTWTLHNKSKSGSVVESYRGKNRTEQRIRVDSPVPLVDRARVRLVGDVYAEVRWVPCTIGFLRVPALESDEVQQRAAQCGVHLVSAKHGLDARCTHLCVANVRPNKTQLLALVRGLLIVSEAFVSAVLACPSESAWPDSRLYTPPLDMRLGPDAHISAAQLAPSSRRSSLFRGTTLVIVLPGHERRYVRRCTDAVRPGRASRGRRRARVYTRHEHTPAAFARRCHANASRCTSSIASVLGQEHGDCAGARDICPLWRRVRRVVAFVNGRDGTKVGPFLTQTRPPFPIPRRCCDIRMHPRVQDVR